MRLVSLNMISGTRFDEDHGLEVETTKPVTINAAAVRAFYARRNDKPGTRITFTDGGGFAVSEMPDAVEAGLDA